MAKKKIDQYVFKPGMSYLGNLYPNAWTLLNANRSFIIAEAMAWIADQVQLGQGSWNGYTYDVAKCQRDIGYVVDAVANDVRYGGNEETIYVANHYWDGETPQVDGDRMPEILTHGFLKTLYTNYILLNQVQAQPAQTAIPQVVDQTITPEAVSYTPSDATYNPATGVMTLTIGSHNFAVGDTFRVAESGLTFTCGKDNNASLHPYPRSSGVPNATGHDPYFNKNMTITAVTSTTVTTNVGISSDTSPHTFVSATTDAIQSSAIKIVEGLFDIVVDTITNGLSALPATVENSYGKIKVAERVRVEDLLLITNVTRGLQIFNFNDASKVAEVEFKKVDTSSRNFQQTYLNSNEDTDFPTFLQNGDYVTTIKLYHDTTDQRATDALQIFKEEKEIRTRPFDFGTDAIERNRVGAPLSMLDADFEYGLQPTKWQAIGTLRGYPSIYEVPGTDTEVVSVVTDASAGTNGVGQSLITVTTQGNHGFVEGDPITIKALENSIKGFNRAEGSFVITTIPADNQFTFYAKAKVGSTNGQVLSTNYTQLRQGGFYTGANISEAPTFTVSSNGSNGSFTLPLPVASGQSRLPFTGIRPELGAPLTYTANPSFIPTGAQVTGVVGNGGNPEITKDITSDIPTGSSSITVDDATGVLQGMAVDIGDAQTLYVASVLGNTINLDGNTGQELSGDGVTYFAVEGTNEQPNGTSATFDVTNSNGTYTVAVNSPGSGYKVGDYIKVPGNLIGGENTTNDLDIKVDTLLSSAGDIDSVSFTGTASNGNFSYTSRGGVTDGGVGIDAVFDVNKSAGVYTVSVSSPDTSQGYEAGDRINIPGTLLGGSTPTNDCLVQVSTVGASGEITSVSASGTATDANFTYTGFTYTYTGGGTLASFDVQKTGTVYTVTMASGGTGYSASDIIIIPGDQLDGTSPANDVTITVNTVDGNGQILTYSDVGTGANVQNYEDLSYGQGMTNLVGSGALFDVTASAGTYSVVISNSGADSGQNYAQNDTITIGGDQLGGATPTNDATVTVNSVDAQGGILTLSIAGSAYTGFGTFVGVSGNNNAPIGSGGSFEITRNSQIYTVAVNTEGNNYRNGDRIIISGTDLGGETPLNDLELRINTVDSLGGINTFQIDQGLAATGDTITFYSTVTMSENTTQPIPAGETIDYEALATITVNFPSAHGMVPGTTFISTIQSTGTNHTLAAGSFIVTAISSLDSISYQARAVGTIDTTETLLGTIYPRPDSFFIHRPFDGGVQLGTGGPQHGAQAIRQSKKYIRYQSGKGIMYTTGALFAPSYDILNVTANGTGYNSVITVVTDDVDHGLQVGGVIRLLGITTPGYNGDYTVDTIVDERTFTVRSKYYLGNTTPTLSANPLVSTLNWHGATVRAGAYDDQNGIFMEYNGRDFMAVLRSATFQLTGTIAMQPDSNSVTGTNTRFEDQLAVGDRVVIRGMTHVVTRITSQTSMDVSPDFRGVRPIAGAKLAKVIDKKTKQSDFNLDKLDGTGPSGYDMDISKMQMIGIQYSWYGAGFIDYMLRGSDGNFVFFHRIRNSNVNTEAFMRTGNMPVRYEITNESANGKLKEAMDLSQQTVVLEDATDFPDAGTLYIENEIVTYTGKSGNTLTGCTRSASLINFNAGATRTYTASPPVVHSAKKGVVLISNTTTPIISHWGSAFITDGGFDSDRGYLFSYASTGNTISTTKNTVFLLRLAPSVSNAIVGDLGERELLNRAQLLLEGLEITSDQNANDTGGIVVQGILNPQNYPLNPNNVGWGGLSGLAQGGQPSFAQVAPGGSVDWNSGTSITTATATTSAVMNATVTTTPWMWGGRRNYFYATEASVESSYITQGSVLSDSKWPGGTYVTQLTDYGDYYLVRLSQTSTQNIGSNQTHTFALGGSLSNTNYLYFDTTSWEALGATAGTELDNASGQFPPGTAVSQVQGPLNFGSSQYYLVRFSQNSLVTINASSTVTFQFGQPPFAQPGETIFSFIANPGERSTLDLSFIKELTNTTLGGRGTFPNGPDVLAINVYKTSGNDVNANIILRWGEAQA